jgi:hypothetical protein
MWVEVNPKRLIRGDRGAPVLQFVVSSKRVFSDLVALFVLLDLLAFGED